MTQPTRNFCRRTRREFLWEAGAGFTGLALTGLLSQGGFFANEPTPNPANPLAARPPHFPAKAKSVIFLFMYGGPSQVDTFDYKPGMYRLDGQTVNVRTFGRGGHRNQGRVVGPKWNFKQYGQCGKYISDLFPNLGTCADDIAFVHSMIADSPIHGSAMLQMNTGKILSGSPCIGSWVNYGLGTVNQNLPGFCVMLDPTGGPISGAKNWTSGYMPASYQGTLLRAAGQPILDLQRPPGVTDAMQRRMLDTLGAFNREHEAPRAHNSNLSARIASYELAYRMQSSAEEAVDLNQETEETKRLYGYDNPTTQDFARKCILARRLVERGVRFIQIYSGGAHDDSNWDAHGDLRLNHTRHAGRTDKPIAGLIKDLKRRGLLDETLIVWGGEFGRQPTAEYATGTGRDHNAYGFTMWMAGGGVKGGTSWGETDEFGFKAVENGVSIHDLHATMLNQLGIDHTRLTYRYAGRDFRLTDVYGEVVHGILA